MRGEPSHWIADQLIAAVKPGVYSVSVGPDPGVVSAAAADMGLRFFHVDGTEVSTISGFLKAVALAMEFPEYFGHNWDALDECIRDLEWAPGMN